MITIHKNLQEHSKSLLRHVKRHHKKYVFGMIGSAIAVKLIMMLVASIGFYDGQNIFAQEGIVYINETGGDETGGDETGGDETGGDETGGDETGGDETGGDEIGGDETGGDETGGDDSRGDQYGGFFNQCNNNSFNFINPLSGSIVKGEINFSRLYIGENCSGKNFEIYLRDHNQQYIKIGTSSYLDTRFQLDSSLLYSGFYDILSSTGSLIYTGQYSGLNSNFYTGYKIKFIDQEQNIAYTGDDFTIDNQLPEIVTINYNYTGNYNSGTIGISGIVDINFTATEELTGIVVNVLGINANFINNSGLDYKYSIILSNQNSGENIYSQIYFSDIAGNTGIKYSNSNITFDKSAPILNHLSFTGNHSGFDIQRQTNEKTKYNFAYALSGTLTGISVNNTGYYLTGLVNITGLDKNKVYNFELKLSDIVNNEIILGGYFFFNIDGKVLFTYDTVTTSSIIITISTGSTGEISTISNIIKQEVDKFNQCKDSLRKTNISIKINDKDVRINMPNFEKSYIRTLVNSFTIVIMDKLKKQDLTKSDLDDIINRFDSFLVILKLVRDDENQCKQNLSNYHIRSFQKTLEEYKISL